ERTDLFSREPRSPREDNADWSRETKSRAPLRQVIVPIMGATIRLTWMRPADRRDREAVARATAPMLRSLRLPSADLRGRIDDAADRRLRHLQRDPAMLTPRLREVVTLICLGHTLRSAADELGLSRHTVIDYQKNIHVLLGVRNRAQLVATLLGGAPGDTMTPDRV
ncbi:MAG: helix-turn-helix transcriptional regulator, partial [Planctomycetota bacterium]